MKLQEQLSVEMQLQEQIVRINRDEATGTTTPTSKTAPSAAVPLVPRNC